MGTSLQTTAFLDNWVWFISREALLYSPASKVIKSGGNYLVVGDGISLLVPVGLVKLDGVEVFDAEEDQRLDRLVSFAEYPGEDDLDMTACSFNVPPMQECDCCTGGTRWQWGASDDEEIVTCHICAGTTQRVVDFQYEGQFRCVTLVRMGEAHYVRAAHYALAARVLEAFSPVMGYVPTGKSNLCVFEAGGMKVVIRARRLTREPEYY